MIRESSNSWLFPDRNRCYAPTWEISPIPMGPDWRCQKNQCLNLWIEKPSNVDCTTGGLFLHRQSLNLSALARREKCLLEGRVNTVSARAGTRPYRAVLEPARFRMLPGNCNTFDRIFREAPLRSDVCHTGRHLGAIRTALQPAFAEIRTPSVRMEVVEFHRAPRLYLSNLPL